MDPILELKEGFEQFKKTQAEATESLKVLVKEQDSGTKEGIKEAQAKAEKLAKEVQALADRLVEAEQKLVSGINAGKTEAKSLGQLIADSVEYKAFASGQSSKVRIETNRQFSVFNNTISGQGGSPVENQDTLVAPDRLSGIIPGAFRSLRARDVIPGGNTNSNMIEFTRELAFTNNAAETAEGANKSESDITFELANAPVRTIAHWLKATRQILEDSPALASYIDIRLRYGVAVRTDLQIIRGNGSGQNLKGITHSDNRTAFTPTSGDIALDSINKAIYQVIGADYAPTAIIMNPSNWGEIERTKVGSSDNRYVIGDPRSALGPILWGLPVIVSNNMLVDYFAVGAFDIAFQLFQRGGVAVEMTGSNDTDFIKNLVTIRAEERLALAGYRPASVRYGKLVV